MVTDNGWNDNQFFVDGSDKLSTSSLVGVEAASIQWLEWCRTYRGRSPETLRAYSNTMSLFVRWLGCDRPVRSLTGGEIERFVSRPRRGRPPAAATANRDLATLKSFLGWCVARGVLDVSPAALVHGPTVRGRQPKPIPDDVWVQWWDAGLPDSLRILLGLGFYGGLRRAEMMGLTGGNYQDRKLVKFVRKGGGEHTVPLGDMTDILVDRLGDTVGDPRRLFELLDRTEQSGWLVNFHIRDPQECNRRINKAAIRFGLPRFTPHQLRHSAASNLVRAGVPLHLVASLMNHSNIQITMGYVSSGGEQLTEWKRNLGTPNTSLVN